METQKNEQPENVNEILKFLTETISPEELATQIRHANYTLALCVMRSNENTNPIDKNNAESSFYWLNDLAETLYPILEKEQYIKNPHDPIKEIKEYLDKTISPKSLAQKIRVTIYIITLSFFRSEVEESEATKQNTCDSIYFLNELAEILHPVLEA